MFLGLVDDGVVIVHQGKIKAYQRLSGQTSTSQLFMAERLLPYSPTDNLRAWTIRLDEYALHTYGEQIQWKKVPGIFEYTR